MFPGGGDPNQLPPLFPESGARECDVMAVLRDVSVWAGGVGRLSDLVQPALLRPPVCS